MSNASLFHALTDLELRRDKYQEDIDKIEEAITALRAAMELNVNIQPSQAVAVSAAEDMPKYANMSVRWAVLKFLYEASTGPTKSADISSALLNEGNPKATKATVSAVISDMVKQRNEVRLVQGGYTLTIEGRAAWGAIKQSKRYENRASAAAAEAE